MLLESAKVIFVHVPKTAGNYCSNVFIDCGLASDGKIITVHQDGVDRFEIRGDFTETKHQTLATYRTALKDEFAEYTVLTVLRDPIERLTSLYLSPHRWMVERFSTRMFVRPYVGFGRLLGSWTENALGVGRVDKLRQYRCVEPRHVDYDAFSRLVRDARSTSQFLALTEGSQPRSFWTLEFKSLTSDLERFLSLKGVEKRLPTRRSNEGTSQGLAREMLADQRIVDIVMDSHHSEDVTLLERLRVRRELHGDDWPP